MTRKEIRSKIRANLKAIQKLQKENRALAISDHLLCDKKQRYSESVIEVVISKRPRETVKVLVGRIHWKEKFVDMDTDKFVLVERSRVVREDGEWIL